MPFPRATSAEYNDLNGEECFEIAHTHLYNLLKDIPEFQRRFALTRVILRVEVSLDIWGATPNKKVYQQKHTIDVTDPIPDSMEAREAHYTRDSTIDSRSNPPDQVRDDHGLPIPRGVKSATLGVTETQLHPTEDEPLHPRPPAPLEPKDLVAPINPANLGSPTSKTIGRRRYAAFVEQDFGAVMTGERTGGEGPIIGGEKAASIGGQGGDHAPVQPDFQVHQYRGQDPDRVESIVSSAVERGYQIDAELEQQRKLTLEQERQSANNKGQTRRK